LTPTRKLQALIRFWTGQQAADDMTEFETQLAEANFLKEQFYQPFMAMLGAKKQ